MVDDAMNTELTQIVRRIAREVDRELLALDDDGLLTRDRIHQINLETGKRMRELADTTDGKFSPDEMGNISWAGEYAKLEAQRDATRDECRDKLQRLITDYTKYIEVRKSDLSGMPPLSVSHGESLKVRREAMDEALKIFLHLANK